MQGTPFRRFAATINRMASRNRHPAIKIHNRLISAGERRPDVAMKPLATRSLIMCRRELF